MDEGAQQNVLIVNAQPQESGAILRMLAGKGIRGTLAGDAKTARAKLASRRWDLVLVDVRAGEASCYEPVRQVRACWADVPVVAIGTADSAAPALRALREGCLDYLTAPLSQEALSDALSDALGGHEVPFAAVDDEHGRWQIAGCSPRLMETVQLARKVAPTAAPVLITGESGTGKELISHLVHQSSGRRHGPYVRLNCAALSESLLESELFGHERGAFTGAHVQRKGRFERAHGGTLLLDEISETSARLQSELLRVLEQQELERLGGSEPVRVDVRVICTSNRNVVREVAQGRFRKDLYYRICGVRLRLAPLRERKEDLPTLVWHFVNEYAAEARRRIKKLDEEMLEAFAGHDWPGNVRELRNVVRTALILGEGELLSLHPTQRPLGGLSVGEAAPGCLSLRELERRAIYEALRRTKSHQAKAARLLGITDRTLREKLRRYRQEGKAQPQAQAVGEGRWIAEPA